MERREYSGLRRQAAQALNMKTMAKTSWNIGNLVNYIDSPGGRRPGLDHMRSLSRR
jgi:hypothetical protein